MLGEYVINVMVPLFLFISGYLFNYRLMLGRYPTWGILLQKKDYDWNF